MTLDPMEHRGVTIGKNPGCPAVSAKRWYLANYIVGPLLLPNGLDGQEGGHNLKKKKSEKPNINEVRYEG